MARAGAPRDRERALIERSRQGDASAFAHLVSTHHVHVRAYIGGWIRRPDVVDELAQEVFVNAFRSLGSFEGDAPFGVWLLRVAHHETLLHLREEARRVSRGSGSLEALLAPMRVKLIHSEEMEIERREREISALERCFEGLLGMARR
jgi:RNA polymerase sigma-70 factor (ECF subfamily)